MSEYLHLIGSEDVMRAASNMQSAADSMRQTHNWAEQLTERQRTYMDDWLNRFEQVLKDADERAARLKHGDMEAGPR